MLYKYRGTNKVQKNIPIKYLIISILQISTTSEYFLKYDNFIDSCFCKIL